MPRWSISIEPTGEASTSASLRVIASGVTHAEVAAGLVSLTNELLKNPHAMLATEAEVLALRVKAAADQAAA